MVSHALTQIVDSRLSPSPPESSIMLLLTRLPKHFNDAIPPLPPNFNVAICVLWAIQISDQH